MPWEDGIQAYSTAHGIRYKIRVNFLGPDNARKVKEVHGFPSKRQAQYARDKIRNARFEQRIIPTKTRDSLSLKTSMEQWINDYVVIHCKNSTVQSYQQVLSAYIFPRLGHLSPGSITPGMVSTLFMDLQGHGLAKQTLKNIFLPLREFYGHFISRYPDRIPGNPVLVLKPYLKGLVIRRGHIRPLNREQVSALITAAQSISPLASLLVLMAARTGLRRGELLGLKWDDCDLKKHMAIIRETIVRGQSTTPKNHHARTIDFSPQLVDALKEWPKDHRTPYIFHTHGKRVSASYINILFKRVAMAAQMPLTRLKDLRHYYASALIDLGANPKYIQKQLGHSTINVTFDIYGHLFQEQNDIVVRLDG